ncbi:MAG: hypothetical protein HPY60_01175 [Candidatus Methanofastidiosum sp.]|nr:hypothetical protein [Methanofastidiosum sp.]
MKKLFVILVSLLFVVSVFGVASTMADIRFSAVAAPETVKVGELITVTTNYPSSLDPAIIADGDKPKGDAVLVSRPATSFSKGLFPVEQTFTWIYRATAPGTIKFDFGPPTSAKINGNIVSNPVTITSNSLPMFKFMKILGFGNESA